MEMTVTTGALALAAIGFACASLIWGLDNVLLRLAIGLVSVVRKRQQWRTERAVRQEERLRQLFAEAE